MKLIAHVGLGKTGTSAIQHALKAELGYLGYWLPCHEHLNTSEMFAWLKSDQHSSKALEMHETFSRFAKEVDTDTLIWSNESICNSTNMLESFRFLRDNYAWDVDIIIYIRNPAKWLVSAFEQWGIYDKILPGKITGFKSWCNWGVNAYRSGAFWASQPDVICREYVEGKDVVEDFNKVTGLSLEQNKRVYEKRRTAELFARGIYNDLSPFRVPSSAFSKYNPKETLSEMFERMFNMSNFEQAVGKCKTLISGQLEFSSKEKLREHKFDDSVRDELLDMSVVLVIKALAKIDELEKEIEKLNSSD